MQSTPNAAPSAKVPRARRLTLKPLAGVWRGTRRPAATVPPAPTGDFAGQPAAAQQPTWTRGPSAMTDSECRAHTRSCADCGQRWLEFRTMLRQCPFCRRRGHDHAE